MQDRFSQMEEMVQVSLCSTSASSLIQSTSRASYLLSVPIDVPVHAEAAMGLASLSVPRSWYNVTSSTNSIRLNGVTYQVAPGSYGATGLATALTTALSAIPASVTYNSTLMGFTITAAVPITLDATLSTMRRAIGFSTSQGPSTTLQSDTSIDLAGTRSIHLVFDNMNSTLRESFTGGATSSTIDVIPVTVQSGSILNYISSTIRWLPIRGGMTISEITVSILDDEGNLLDLRGANYELCFAVRMRMLPADPAAAHRSEGPSLSLGDTVQYSHMR